MNTLRIAAGITQGLALGADLPVVPISTLRAMAQSAWVVHDFTHVLVAQNAFMGEVYWAAYQLNENDVMVAEIGDCLVKPDMVKLPDKRAWVGIGDGWDVYPNELSKRSEGLIKHLEPDCYPHAQDIAKLASLELDKAISAEAVSPVYLRGRDAWKKSDR